MRIRFGSCTFDDTARELLVDGVVRLISPKAYQLLALLIEAAPRPVTQQELYDALWPDVVVEAGNLHNLVAEVRKALDDDGKQVIRTIHRVGYAFTPHAAPDESLRYAVLVGDDEIPLRPGPNLIGRDPHDTVVIHAPEVSRHHARITVSSTGLTIEDLGSKNGTFVGTTRVTSPAPVGPGDDILVGTIRIRVIALDAQAPTATVG